ncbi:MAG: DUF3784 domain-containing protein [Oscillospiraceae bacterium]
MIVGYIIVIFLWVTVILLLIQKDIIFLPMYNKLSESEKVNYDKKALSQDLAKDLTLISIFATLLVIALSFASTQKYTPSLAVITGIDCLVFVRKILKNKLKFYKR